MCTCTKYYRTFPGKLLVILNLGNVLCMYVCVYVCMYVLCIVL